MSRITERKSNFELLRIISMLLIIASHIFVHGIATDRYGAAFTYNWTDGTIINKLFACMLPSGGFIGVGLFFMITGFFQINRNKITVKRLILQCLFYSILAIVAYGIIHHLGYGDVLKADEVGAQFIIWSILMPVSSSVWWFAGSYFILLLISPVINKALKSMDTRGRFIILIVIGIIYYVVAYYTRAPLADLGRASFFYVLGAIVKLDRSEKQSGKALNLSIGIFLWLVYGLLTFLRVQYPSNVLLKISPIFIFALLVPFATYNIFLFFEKIDIGSNKFINTVAATTFGIYLFHDSNVMRPTIWETILQVHEVQFVSSLFPLFAILDILGVFAVGSLIDLFRLKCLEPVAIKVTDKILTKLLHYQQ